MSCSTTVTCTTSLPAHLHLTQAPAKAVQLPPMQKHPLPATVTPKYKPPPVCFDRPKPAADQPELGPHPPAPHPVRSTLEEPPPPPPGPVPTEPSVKQGPPPKTPPPRIPRREPQCRSSGHSEGPGSRRLPRRGRLRLSARRFITRWTQPTLAPSRNRPRWTLGCFLRLLPIQQNRHQPKPPPPPAIVKPCAFQDYRKTTPPEPKRCTPGTPGRCDRSGPRRRDRRTVNPRLVDGFRVRGALALPRRRSRSPRLERRLPPQTRRQIRRRRLPRPRQRRNTNLPTRAEHKLPSQGTLRDCRGESGVIAGTPIGSTLIPSGERPPDDRHPSTPTRPSCAYWTCGTGTDTWERT